MNPKIEVVKLNIAKKGQQVGTFSVKVGFDSECEVTLPGMRIVEGAKETFVDVPSRQFKDVGFVPHYYLNKALKDLITDQALDAYEQAVAEGKLEQAGVPAAAKPATASTAAATGAPSTTAEKPTVPAHAKTWPRKEWKPSTARK
jgi:DNA-binding cell septation regulator SpoVG